MTRAGQLLSVLTVALFLGLAGFELRHTVAMLGHPYPTEYGEGVNLLWASRLADGLPLYPAVSKDDLPHLHHPYPPLGPLAVGTLRRAMPGSSPFLPGRLVSVVGAALAGLGLWILARRRLSAAAATVAVALFALSPVTLRFGPMMRIDPLPLGLSLLALVLVDRNRTPAQFAVAAALAALAALAKPTYVAALLVVGSMALLQPQRRRSAAAAAVGALIPLAAIGAWIAMRESPHLWLHMVALHRLPADPGGLLDWAGRFAGVHALLLAGLAAWLRYGPTEDRHLRCYAAIALGIGLVSGLTMGSQENYLFEALAMSALAAAWLWERVRRSAPATAWAAAAMQGLLFLPIEPAPVFTRTYGQELPPGAGATWRITAADREIGDVITAEIDAADGAVLSSDVGYLLAAGRDPVMQPYQFGRLAEAGRWDLATLARAVEEGRFGLIILKGEAEEADDPYFPPRIQQAIHTRYALHRVIGPWHLYRPSDHSD